MFIKLNGYDLVASPEDRCKTIIRVAASYISDDELAQELGKLERDKKLNPLNFDLLQKFGGSDKLNIWVALSHNNKQ